MFYHTFKSEKKRTPFAPEWDYKIGITKINDINTNTLRDIILKEEKVIIKKYKDLGNAAYTGLGYNSLTSKYPYFNVLSWENPEIYKLREKIVKYHNQYCMDVIGYIPSNKIYIQCWANVLRYRQKINTHLHDFRSKSYLSGHFTVKANKTNTVYVNPINTINDPEEYYEQNEEGKLTFFPSNIPHYTTRNNSFSKRITIAFDIVIHEELVKDNHIIIHIEQ